MEEEAGEMPPETLEVNAPGKGCHGTYYKNFCPYANKLYWAKEDGTHFISGIDNEGGTVELSYHWKISNDTGKTILRVCDPNAIFPDQITNVWARP